MVGEKIMIVEDNGDFARELEDILDSCGYETVTVSDGERVYEAACSTKPQVILLDLRLGAVNGFTVAAQLRGSPETADIPVIAMSGYFPIEQISSLMDMSSVDARLKKPFSILELVGQIERILSKKPSIMETETVYEMEARDEKCYA